MGQRDRDVRWRIARRSNRAIRSLAPRRQKQTEPDLFSRPIFVVGTMRGGTTLLAKYLGVHPDVCYVGFELNRAWREIGKIDFAVTGNGASTCPPLGRGEATPERIRELRDGFGDIFEYEKNGGRQVRLLIKNPHFCNKLPFLHAVFPDTTLVISSRDIRSSVASIKRFWQQAHESHGTRYYLPHDPTFCWTISPPASLEGCPRDRTLNTGYAATK
jgi:hypothetical protein